MLTRTMHSKSSPPTEVVILQVPLATAVTVPLLSTVATLLSLEVHAYSGISSPVMVFRVSWKYSPFRLRVTS